MNYESLVGRINLIQDALQSQAAHAVNLSLTARNWLVEIIRLSKTAELAEWSTPPERLFYRLNYTILSYLATIDDPLKRAFYEQETIRGCWTVTELDRQVSSQYYERMGLSKDKKALQRLVDDNPPVGILLCTDYGETTVQYATEGLSQNLFVSKYRLQLPSEDEIRKYLLENITEEEFRQLKAESEKEQ